MMNYYINLYTYPEFLNYAKIGVTHFCGKKASDSNTLSASLLIFKISHPLEKKKCIFNKETLRSNPYKKSACLTWPRFQEIVNFKTLIKSDQNMISF